MTRAARKREWRGLDAAAADMAEGSVVTRALGRYIAQILDFVYTDQIAPLETEIVRLQAEIDRLKGEA